MPPEKALLTDSVIYLRQKILIVQLFGTISTVALIIYTYLNFRQENLFGVLLSVFAILLITYSVFHASTTNKLEFAAPIGGLVTVAMVVYHFYIGGFEPSGLLYIFPTILVLFLLLGLREGILYNVMMLIGLQLVFVMGETGLAPKNYEASLIFMSLIAFILTVLLVGFLTYILESTALSMWRRDQLVNEMSRLRDNLMGIIGHQFRTPLSIIRWNNELILSEANLPPAQAKLVQENQVAVLGALDQITDIMAVLDLKKSQTKVKLENFQACKLLAERVATYIKTYPEKVIKFDPGNTMDVTIYTDKEKLIHIFRILVENAIIYTPKDGRVEIKFNYDPKHLLYEITVADDGIGIAPNEEQNMYKLFHRGDSAVKVKPSGSGVGLYIAKEFTKLLNGELVYTSSPGRGATFKLTLPWVG